MLSASGVGGVAHAGQNATHVREAGDDAGHWIVAVYLVFQIDKALVPDGDESFKNIPDWHDAFADGNLTILVGETGQILEVHVVEARPGGVNRLDQIGAGAGRVAHIDAASDARVQILDRLQHVEGRRKELILRVRA